MHVQIDDPKIQVMWPLCGCQGGNMTKAKNCQLHWFMYISAFRPYDVVAFVDLFFCPELQALWHYRHFLNLQPESINH